LERRKKNSKFFTLLELMVSFALIGLVGSLIIRGGYDLLSHYQFRSSAQSFLSDIQRFQIMAMTVKCDVECSIEKEKGGYKVMWRPDAFFSSEEKGGSFSLKGVEKLYLESKEYSKLAFTIFSTGRLSESGILTFLPKKEENSCHIDLSYPIELQRVKEKISCQIPPYPLKKAKNTAP
jgi:hypothetical protein